MSRNNTTFEEIIVALLIYIIFGVVVLDKLAIVMFPSVSLIIKLVKYTLIGAILILHSQNKTKVKIPKSFLLFFSIYVCYIFIYMTILRVYPLEEMAKVPTTIEKGIFNTLILYLLIYCAPTIIKYLNFRYITIIMCLGAFVPSLLYIHVVGVSALQAFGYANEDETFLSNLTMGYNCLIPTSLVAMFYDKLTSKKYINYFILIASILAGGYIIIMCTKRGPILWLFVTLLILFYYKEHISYKYLIYIAVIGIVLYFSFDLILQALGQIAPFTAERISKAIYEGSTSSRMSSDSGEACYPLALEQFANSPLIGSYFRLITNGHFRGHYPHNIFLEVLITMGLFGFIPFIGLLYKAALNIHKTLSKDFSPYHVIPAICFISWFLQLMTTNSILLNYPFWFSFAMVIVLPKIHIKVPKTRKKIPYE